MKNHSELKSIFSLLLIFVVLLQQFGCISTIKIQPADLSIHEGNQYKLRYRSAVYDVKEAQVSNDTLHGKIDLTYKPPQKNNVVYIQPIADSQVKIDSNYYFSLPLTGITKVYKEVKSPGKTSLAVIGSIAGIFLIVLAFSLRINYRGL